MHDCEFGPERPKSRGGSHLTSVAPVHGWLASPRRRLEHMRRSFWHSLAWQSAIILLFVALFWILASLSPVTTKPPRSALVLVGALLLLCFAITAGLAIRMRNRGEGIRAFLLNNPQIWVVIPYIALSARDLAVVPTCDNGTYFRTVLDAVSGFNFVPSQSLQAMKLFGHPSFGYAAYMMLGQFIDYGDYVIANVQSRLLAVAAILAFGGIVGSLFPGKDRRPERILGTALFAFTPLVYGLSLTVSPDFAVAAFLCLTVYCHLRDLRLLGLASGIMLSFSKEAGALLYATLVVGVYAVQLPWATVRAAQGRWKAYLHGAVESLYLAIPVFLFGLYLIVDGQLWSFRSAADVAQKLSRSSLDVTTSYDKTVQVFLANFNWLVWGLILISLLVALARTVRSRLHREETSMRDPWPAFLLLITGPFLVVNYLFKTWNNARYIVPISIIAVVLLVKGLSVLTKRPMVRNGVLLGCLGLFAVGSFRTIDPVLLHLFPTFVFGEHRMSFYNSQRTVCDLTLYNREYVYFNVLFDDFLAETGFNPQTDKLVFFAAENSADLVSWNTAYLWTGNAWTGDIYVDPVRRSRTYQQNGGSALATTVFVSGVDDPRMLPKHAFSIQLFWTSRLSSDSGQLMREYYDVVRTIRIERDGYFLDAYELASKAD